MKIRVEIDPEAPEEEIVLRCRELTPEVVKLQQLLAKQIKSTGQIILYQNDTEYYLETDRILFFETELLLKVFQTFAVKSSHSTHLRIFLEQFKCNFLMRWICGRDTAAGVVRGHIVLCYCQF